MATTPTDFTQDTDPLISVIVPIRNRCGTRVDNCLRSLRWQDLPPEHVEIILSDFGSDPEQLAAVEALAASHNVRVVSTPTDSLWNRSRALNIGIRSASGAYTLCTDADMIFQPNFLSTLLLHVQQANDRTLVLCRCRDLPSDVPEQPWQAEDYDNLLARSTYRERLGVGACQMARTRFFTEIRGYDEGYVFWGCEDRDLAYRAARFGLSQSWVHDTTSMLHQWHPTLRHERPVLKMLNDIRFHLTKFKIRKNGPQWGT